MISTINDKMCSATSTIVIINREKSRMLREIKKLIDRNNFLLSRKENLIFLSKIIFHVPLELFRSDYKTHTRDTLDPISFNNQLTSIAWRNGRLVSGRDI